MTITRTIATAAFIGLAALGLAGCASGSPDAAPVTSTAVAAPHGAGDVTGSTPSPTPVLRAGHDLLAADPGNAPAAITAGLNPDYTVDYATGRKTPTGQTMFVPDGAVAVAPAYGVFFVALHGSYSRGAVSAITEVWTVNDLQNPTVIEAVNVAARSDSNWPTSAISSGDPNAIAVFNAVENAR